MAAAKKLDPRVTLKTTPTIPVPNKTFRLQAVTGDTTTGNFCRIWCLAAPPGTKLRQELDDSRASRVAFQPMLRIGAGDGGRRDWVDVTLEKGGGYVFQLDELQVGTGFTGGYESDPRGAPSETIRSTGQVTFYVASPLTMQLGCGSDTATLKLYVLNDTIVQTELAVHGETTPRIDVSPSATSKARLAAENDDVRSALAALAGQTAETLVGDLGASLDDLLTEFNAHLTQSGRHYSNDTTDAVSDSFFGATTVSARAATLRELRRRLDLHMRNDAGPGADSGPGTGTAAYHRAADWANLPLDAASPSDALNDAIAHADAWRAYEGHRVSGVHKHADQVNKAKALPPLLELHRAFIAVLAAASAPVPATAPSGAALLISQLGLKDA